MANDPLSLAFGALADPTRRAILSRLSEGEATVGELADPFDMTLPAISNHLRVLERAGLIVREVDAQRRRCRLTPQGLAQASGFIAELANFWEGGFARLEKILAAEDQQADASADEGAVDAGNGGLKPHS